jgi:uncharacterized protein
MSTRQEGKAIRRLQLLVPKFECIPGCTDCCGPVPFSKWEWEQVQDKRSSTSLSCVYSSKQGCEIYDKRPMVCRLFGASEDERLVCPHGKMPDKPLTVEETNRISKEYISWIPNISGASGLGVINAGKVKL